jgi:hypothetical protein
MAGIFRLIFTTLPQYPTDPEIQVLLTNPGIKNIE